jgi:U-box domain
MKRHTSINSSYTGLTYFMEHEPFDGTTAEAARDYGIKIPSEFLCPITLEVMIKPLMSKYGHHYERDAILEWIGSSGTCPLTRRSLGLRDLLPNKALEDKIAMWIWENALPRPTNGRKKNHDNIIAIFHGTSARGNMITAS